MNKPSTFARSLSALGLMVVTVAPACSRSATTSEGVCKKTASVRLWTAEEVRKACRDQSANPSFYAEGEPSVRCANMAEGVFDGEGFQLKLVADTEITDVDCNTIFSLPPGKLEDMLQDYQDGGIHVISRCYSRPVTCPPKGKIA